MASNDQRSIDVTKAFIVLSIEEDFTHVVIHRTFPKEDKSCFNRTTTTQNERLREAGALLSQAAPGPCELVHQVSGPSQLEWSTTGDLGTKQHVTFVRVPLVPSHVPACPKRIFSSL